MKREQQVYNDWKVPQNNFLPFLTSDMNTKNVVEADCNYSSLSYKLHMVIHDKLGFWFSDV